MAKKSKQKLLLIMVLLILLSSSAYAALAPKVHAADMTLQQKGMAILSDAVGLDLTKYQIFPKEYPKDHYLDVLPTEDIQYNLVSDESNLKLLCTFTDGNLHILHVLEREGSPHTTKPAISVLEMAKDLLRGYQTFSGNMFYEELASMLDTIDANNNLTKPSGTYSLK